MSRVCSLGAKIKVIVLDEGGATVCNRIFHACAKRPSGPPLARAVRCYGRLRVVPAHDIKRSCRIRIVSAILPRPTTLGMQQTGRVEAQQKRCPSTAPSAAQGFCVRRNFQIGRFASFLFGCKTNGRFPTGHTCRSPLSCIRLAGSEEASLAQSCSAIASSPRFVIR
jgi:hypothetical protein